ncbi:DUF167 family protein [Aminobacter sp. HY435]|uniref:DUF167 family protein n=1 Tax=Aminobacter sp. HY435 TaxID=2970917 RepID=UPI0022B948E3|nr:DUF167 family protein [Aminobacter sp. HY435]
MVGFFRLRDDGIELFVRLTPKASKDAVGGVESAADGRGHLAARVRAVPEKGAANAALERLLAKALGVSRSSVSVVAGGTSRLKTVRIAGDPTELSRSMAAIAQA